MTLYYTGAISSYIVICLGVHGKKNSFVYFDRVSVACVLLVFYFCFYWWDIKQTTLPGQCSFFESHVNKKRSISHLLSRQHCALREQKQQAAVVTVRHKVDSNTKVGRLWSW